MNSHPTSLSDTIQTRNRVAGLTHNFYCYPARFSPEFARKAILEYSQEGDTVLDTFMGGGTTVVEAVASGRNAVGIDINPLAHFITRVKTTPLSSQDESAIIQWITNIQDDTIDINLFGSDPRLKNVPDDFKQFFFLATDNLRTLRFPRQRQFARCALMKLGQWAIDNRKVIPGVDQLKTHLMGSILEMFGGLHKLVSESRDHNIAKGKITGRRALYIGDANDVINNHVSNPLFKPKLVLTSPPYPGVHVLYHRWQIHGRKETPLPYWIADLNDGHGESHYTLGGRSKKGKIEYFLRLKRTYQSLRSIIDLDTTVVQLVAFSEPDMQLPAFLDCMTSAGYEELTPFHSIGADRPSRTVPHRKWYTQLNNNQHASNEVLLIHRPA